MTDKTIGRAAAGIAALAALIAIVFVADLLGLIPTGPFWENLFAGVLSGLIIMIAVALLLPHYLKIYFAPRVRLQPDETFRLTRYFDGRYKGTLLLSIRNDGTRTLKSFYWHLIVPRGLNPVVQDLKGRIIGARKIGDYEYIRGLVDDRPVFPSSNLELPIRVAFDTADARPDWEIKYSLTTEYGHFPKEMELHQRMDQSALADCAELKVYAETNQEIVPLTEEERAAAQPQIEKIELKVQNEAVKEPAMQSDTAALL